MVPTDLSEDGGVAGRGEAERAARARRAAARRTDCTRKLSAHDEDIVTPSHLVSSSGSYSGSGTVSSMMLQGVGA